ncbi:MAG: hypothetical protein VYB48_10385 [Pseudomonadota bacterium]|jgi:hypothetical protein|nr:hypothetical protein [Pseudomonadota bacterium]MEC8102970.1 hypothetical protein [Pseudomonadota bacterium]MEC8525114.1 hypothetical protein [Pseudomonadota bacterium]|tara:strand:+ start:257 stop:673 length:417 start_codon:yes stop_codon:yes gene_type:complete
MSSSVIKAGFIAAAVANISGVLLFSKGLTNTVLMETDPVVMSSFGLIMIMVWGLAYLAAAFTQANLKWFAAAFAVEKLVYVICWLTWISSHSLSDVYQQDLFAGIFYGIYGVNDAAFMLFFVWVYLKSAKAPVDTARS